MPMMAVLTQEYAFEGPDDRRRSRPLRRRRQLIVYRFFFDPGVTRFPEEGCDDYSFYADQISHLAQLRARDASFVAVSRARRSTSGGSRSGSARTSRRTPRRRLSKDFGVGEWHGTNVFLHDDETASSAPTS